MLFILKEVSYKVNCRGFAIWGCMSYNAIHGQRASKVMAKSTLFTCN